MPRRLRLEGADSRYNSIELVVELTTNRARLLALLRARSTDPDCSLTEYLAARFAPLVQSAAAATDGLRLYSLRWLPDARLLEARIVAAPQPAMLLARRISDAVWPLYEPTGRYGGRVEIPEAADILRNDLASLTDEQYRDRMRSASHGDIDL